MNEDIIKRLDAIEQKLEATYVAAEKSRKYLFWTFVITIVVLVLPMIGLFFVIPAFLSGITGIL